LIPADTLLVHHPSRKARTSGADSGPCNDLEPPFQSINHARFHDADTPYHVVFRVLQGRFLLRPDRKGRLNSIIAGVIGRAQELFPSIRLYAHAWLSNHAHLLLQGSAEDIPAFVGFLKREISRRWGVQVDWPGPMWEAYESTALPTPESQREAFAYVMAQSTKENLVASPVLWPGVHCARDLIAGTCRRGVWFDGTAYGKAAHRTRTRRNPRGVNRADYERCYSVTLRKIPCWSDLDDHNYREKVRALVESIVDNAAATRGGDRVRGRRAVLSVPRDHRSSLPPHPWYEKRRRMICWASRTAKQTRKYLRDYWEFQRRFRDAARRFLAGELQAAFPPGSFRPPLFARLT
jgi:REP element-mobilizing transposase RayT